MAGITISGGARTAAMRAERAAAARERARKRDATSARSRTADPVKPRTRTRSTEPAPARTRLSEPAPARTRARTAEPARTRTQARATEARTTRRTSTANPRTQPARRARVAPNRTQQRARTTAPTVQSTRRRLLVVGTAFFLGFATICVYLVWMQVYSGERHSQIGVNQRSRVETLTATRGRILDRSGTQLAITVPAPTIVANPKMIADPEGAAAQIAPIVGEEAATLAKRFKDPDSSFAYVARQVDQGVADRVAALAIPGITLQTEPRRFYPSNDLAAPTLGVVGIDDTGLSGAEYWLNQALTGRAGSRKQEVDQAGHRISETTQTVKAAEPGKDVVLTLDSGIQYETQQALIDEATRVNADGGTAVVMDIESGDILAVATVAKSKNGTVRAADATQRNSAFTDVYEPGSTNKIVTMAAAIEAGVVGPQTSLDVPLTISQGGAFQQDEHRAKAGPMTVTQIFEKSSNVGTIKIAQLLGADRLDAALRDFGFGTTSSVNFPGESGGVMLDRENYSDTSMITIPIGYGLAVTPMQMLDVYATIANDGIPVQPRLVLGTMTNGTLDESATPDAKEPVVSASTAQAVRGMLQAVVADGTGLKAQIPGYSVAGKTGTARKPPYTTDEHMSSFAGFAPATNPKVATIVVLDNPRTEYYGGDVAAPAFKRIMSYALDVLHVPADQPLPAKQ